MKKISIIALALISLCLAVLFLYKKDFSLERKGVVETTSSSQEVVTPTPQNSIKNLLIVEKYTGTQAGKPLTISITSFTAYSIVTENEMPVTGSVNTERGFGDDENATVYVLDWDKDAKLQKRYVRPSSDPTHLFAVDASGKINKEVSFKKD